MSRPAPKTFTDVTFCNRPFHCLLRGNWFLFGATLGSESLENCALAGSADLRELPIGDEIALAIERRSAVLHQHIAAVWES